jgi:hypothetical protein
VTDVQAVAEIAPDPALPQLSLLLEPERVGPILARSLGREISEARVAYVTYDPGQRILVHYEVAVDTESHDAVVIAEVGTDLAARANDPDSLMLVTAVNGRTPALTPLAHDPEHDVLVQWPPLDLALPALAHTAEGLRLRMEEAGVTVGEGAPQLIHYKPGRRVALRLGNHFLKLYASRGQFERAIHNLRAVEALPIRTPICEAAIEDLRIGVQSFVPGAQPSGSKSCAHDAGAVLAHLHSARLEGLRAAPAPYWLKSAAKSAGVLSAVVPSLADRLQALVLDLEHRMLEEDAVPCHCDFDVRQLLEEDGDFALVDFDSMSSAPPALDLASYISFVADHAGLQEAAVTLDALVDGYGPRPDTVPWYLAIILLRRARIPFRRQLEGWPELIEQRVALAETALRS